MLMMCDRAPHSSVGYTRNGVYRVNKRRLWNLVEVMRLLKELFAQGWFYAFKLWDFGFELSDSVQPEHNYMKVKNWIALYTITPETEIFLISSMSRC